MSYNPNQPRGGRTNPGNWTAYENTSPEAALANPVSCTNCDTTRYRGVTHRCAAPGLVPLTPAAEAIIESIVFAGGRPLVVGGSVRDAFLGLPVNDVDVEVYGVHKKSALVDSLSRVGRVDEFGESFGIISVVAGGETFDVSLPRSESKSGAGHRGFDVVLDPELDEVTAFGRRDFTVNAMGWDPVSGELVDPWAGLTDLGSGVLRHTTDAFGDDPLRVLRAMRFAGRFSFRVAPETAAVAQGMVDTFGQLAKERVWGHWEQMAAQVQDWPASLEALRLTGWDTHFPELAVLQDVEQDARWHAEGDVWTHSGLAAEAAAEAATADGLSADDRMVAVFGALVHDFGKATHTVHEADGSITSVGHADSGVAPAAAFLGRVGAPQHLVDRVLPIVREHMCHITGKPTNLAVRRLVRRLNPDGRGPSMEDWGRVVDADCAGRGPSAKPSPAHQWVEVARALDAAVGPRKPLLSGDALIARGMVPSPLFGPIIAASVVAQDDGLFDNAAGAERWFDEVYSTSLSDRA